MATTTFARSYVANIGLLEEKLEREFWHQFFFNRFTGFAEVKRRGSRMEEVVPSGAPIEVLRDFAKEGMDFMLVPMLKRLTAAGIYGDNQLKGNEEAQNLYWAKAYINQIRNATEQGGRAAMQRVKSLRLFNQMRPSLSRWLAEWNEISVYEAFYKGWSPHLLATTANGGLNLNSGAEKWHPNWFTADAGKVTWNATDATYETSINTALDNLTDVSADHMSAALLENMRTEVIKNSIQPLQVDGFDVWPMILHPNQMRQLRNDTTYRNGLENAQVRSSKNPIFTGASGMYAGFLLYERQLVYGADSSGTLAVGATNPLSALDTNAKKCAIIFGASAIARGWADGPYFGEETDDYGNIQGLGVGMLVGDARADFWDDPDTITAVTNQSSAIVSTYSADAF